MATDRWQCERCGFELYLPVDAPVLGPSVLGLYDDARFPGRCILVYRRHVEHLESLPPDELSRLWQDAARVAGAIRRLTGAARVNYAVLGNATPHLHVHLIPRQPGQEELPTRPPWNDPRPLAGLPPGETARLGASLARLLA